MMWTYSGIMQDIKFFSFCGGSELASCTGMPDGADNYVYAFSYDNTRNSAYLSRTAKNISSILDPTQTQWYAQSNYSPTNTGDGTSWTTLGSQTGAAILWAQKHGTGPTYFNTPNYGLVWGAVNYLCAGAACSYVWVPAGLTSTISMPHPWGPFYSNGAGNTGSAFFNLLPWTAQTVNTTPYSLNIASTWNNYGGVTFYPGLTTAGNVISSVAKGNPTILTSTSNWGTFSGTWNLTISGETASCWTAINGATTATWVSPTSFSIPVNTSACAGSSAGQVFTFYTANGTQFFQPYNLQIAPPHNGQARVGGSNVQFSMGPAGDTLPRKGLRYYFDFYDHRGYTGYSPIVTVDIANYPPASILTTCNTDGRFAGCGFYSADYGSSWSTAGMSQISKFSSQILMTDLTAAQNPISPAMFVGDTSWTVSGITSTSNVGTRYDVFGVGSAGAGSQIQISYDSGAGVSGSFCAIWWTSTTGQGACTAGGLMTNDTPVNWTVTRVGGGPIVGGSSLRIYLNGREASSYTQYAYGSPQATPTVAAGALYMSGYCPTLYTTLTVSTLGVWNRVLSSTEVAHLYSSTRASMKRRGLTLP